MHEDEGRYPLPEEGVLIAKLDSLTASTDYGKDALCMRLVGVSPADFEAAAFNDEKGCETYIIDIHSLDHGAVGCGQFGEAEFWNLPIYLLARMGAIELISYGDYSDDYWRCSFGQFPDSWIKITYAVTNSQTSNYAYCAFRDQEPTFIRLKRVEVLPGKRVNPPATGTMQEALDENSAVALYAYHVGQGMCSLVTAADRGWLIDCGAGTPIKRSAYRKKGGVKNGGIRNDIIVAIGALSNLGSIISHADRDHWCLLEWDRDLLTKVEHIFLPDGIAILALSSPAIKHKVKGIGGGSIMMGSVPLVTVVRSNPSKKRYSNNDCLVTGVHIAGKNALLPGDYVYSGINSDRSAQMRELRAKPFDVLVVPHHGDLKSAEEVPFPGKSLDPLAFFSAGDHKGYCHPTIHSLDAHKTQGYRCISNSNQRNIVEIKLLP